MAIKHTSSFGRSSPYFSLIRGARDFAVSQSWIPAPSSPSPPNSEACLAQFLAAYHRLHLSLFPGGLALPRGLIADLSNQPTATKHGSTPHADIYSERLSWPFTIIVLGEAAIGRSWWCCKSIAWDIVVRSPAYLLKGFFEASRIIFDWAAGHQSGTQSEGRKLIQYLAFTPIYHGNWHCCWLELG